MPRAPSFQEGISHLGNLLPKSCWSIEKSSTIGGAVALPGNAPTRVSGSRGQVNTKSRPEKLRILELDFHFHKGA
ncbi:hypothetical protein chiPu_0006444 [Chiloscyllium punctatum]|uniref:Uncharacterized protein n=1 Tax=Chiloscyllium punctatum TaxID=137246 RepID=A0A401SC90_CHIPU|nr:hypothetical protein [Chiloscyllium punctatum]